MELLLTIIRFKVLYLNIYLFILNPQLWSEVYLRNLDCKHAANNVFYVNTIYNLKYELQVNKKIYIVFFKILL